MLHNSALSTTMMTYNSEMIICRRQHRSIDARFSHLYFCQSLYTLQRGLPAIAGLLVYYMLDQMV